MGPSSDISEEEKMSYLLEFVRGLPRAEVKALTCIKDRKSAEDILQFHKESYSDVQNFLFMLCLDLHEYQSHLIDPTRYTSFHQY